MSASKPRILRVRNWHILLSKVLYRPFLGHQACSCMDTRQHKHGDELCGDTMSTAADDPARGGAIFYWFSKVIPWA